MLTYTHANSTSDGPITTLLSILCILIEVRSGAHAKRKKGIYDFKFGTFIGRFPNDGVGSVAVKGLIQGIVLQTGAQSPLQTQRRFTGYFVFVF